MMARTMFMALYIPHSPVSFDAIIALAKDHKKILQDLKSNVNISGGHGPGSATVTQDELVFTGRIFIFHEDALTLQQRAEADTVYRSRGLGIQFRGIDELMRQWIAEQQSKKH
jgi:hypothetical protein